MHSFVYQCGYFVYSSIGGLECWYTLIAGFGCWLAWWLVNVEINFWLVFHFPWIHICDFDIVLDHFSKVLYLEIGPDHTWHLFSRSVLIGFSCIFVPNFLIVLVIEGEKLWLIRPKLINLRDHTVRHWNYIPRSSDQNFTCHQCIKLVRSLPTITRSQGDCPLRLHSHAILRTILFMYLIICTQRKAILLVFYCLPRHNGFWTVLIQNTTLHWKEIQ